MTQTATLSLGPLADREVGSMKENGALNPVGRVGSYIEHEAG